MTKSKIFFYLFLSFILGVSLASFYYPREILLEFIYFVLIGLIISICLFWRNRKILFWGFIFLFFTFGIFSVAKDLKEIRSQKEKPKFSGVVRVIDEPSFKQEFQTLKVISEEFDGKILIQTGIYPEYFYGDELKIDCDLEIPENFDDDFDYRMYLAKDEIFHICQNPKIQKIDSEKGNIIYANLLKIKNKFNDNINQLIPFPQSGLLSGLLIGGTTGLSEKVKDNFSRTGMTHIVAVSGYNVTIIAEYLMIIGIFVGLWRRQSFWFALIGIIIFVIITGMSASVVRAGVTGVLLIWAATNGRLSNSENAILFSASLMLLINPLLFRWDIGFQLSFLATLGIIYFYPIVENYLVKNNKAFGLSEILFLTLSAQIFVLPIILYNFNQLSLISPIANLLVLPIIPITMLLGFLAILASFIFQPVALIFSWIVFLPLKYETIVINFLADLKFSSVSVNFPIGGMVVWYIILIIGVYFWRIIKKQKI